MLWAANTAAGVVLILLVFDPTRDLRPVFALLAVAVGALLAPSAPDAMYTAPWLR
jgi:hypothetical protein